MLNANKKPITKIIAISNGLNIEILVFLFMYKPISKAAKERIIPKNKLSVIILNSLLLLI